MKYEVAEAPELYKLEEIVNEMIENNWLPQGGLCQTKYGTTTYYSQAMIKHDEVKVNTQPSKKVNTISLREFLDSKSA